MAAVLMCFPHKNVLGVFAVMKNVVLNKPPNVLELIETVVSLAETARRDGLLALEGRIGEIKNPFIVMGIQMAVDGTRPEVIEETLRAEMEAVARRHHVGKSLFDTMGKYANLPGSSEEFLSRKREDTELEDLSSRPR